MQIAGERVHASEAFVSTEAAVREALNWAQLAVELLGGVVVALGVLLSLWLFVGARFRGRGETYLRVRLTLGHYLALALEFLLAADILATAVSPTWDQIGKLAAIATIRTALNYFLMREMKEEGRDLMREGADAGEGGN